MRTLGFQIGIALDLVITIEEIEVKLTDRWCAETTAIRKPEIMARRKFNPDIQRWKHRWCLVNRVVNYA